jgi:hypothetical protein
MVELIITQIARESSRSGGQACDEKFAKRLAVCKEEKGERGKKEK